MDRVPVVPIRGRVLVRGKPAELAEVILVPTQDQSKGALRPRAVAGKDGTFTLGTYGQEDGVPPGEYAVLITWSGPKGFTDPEEEGVPPFTKPPDRLRGKYANYLKTPLRVTIEPDTTELPAFDLK